jgi:hypothetical protein
VNLLWIKFTKGFSIHFYIYKFLGTSVQKLILRLISSVNFGQVKLFSVVGTNSDPSDAIHSYISYIFPFETPGYPRYP